MDNFILLDGWSLTALVSILLFVCLCGIVLGVSSLRQDRIIRNLSAENKKLKSDLCVEKRKCNVANTTLNFMKNRVRELEEEIEVRDEAIAESLKGSLKNG